MSATEVIEQFKALPATERAQVAKFVESIDAQTLPFGLPGEAITLVNLNKSETQISSAVSAHEPVWIKTSSKYPSAQWPLAALIAPWAFARPLLGEYE